SVFATAVLCTPRGFAAGREYNSGGGHLYVNSPLGVGAGSVASHGPSQADKLKTFAALNRTQQSAKKSSEYGNGPPSANGYGSPVPGGSGGAPSMTGGPSGASPRHLGAAAAIGPGGPRPLMKVPSLHKAREVSGDFPTGLLTSLGSQRFRGRVLSCGAGGECSDHRQLLLALSTLKTQSSEGTSWKIPLACSAGIC
ncbi:hypothetical protein Vafri_4913, partial [Volvox africanus]